MPRIANLYFRTAIVFLILGISIGLHMSISGNHAATGAHAHANLLGWVTMAIFGVYHALNPQKAARRLAMIQYAVYTFGVAVLVPSLYLMLSGNAAMEPFPRSSPSPASSCSPSSSSHGRRLPRPQYLRRGEAFADSGTPPVRPL
jgi:hypothetical protein